MFGLGIGEILIILFLIFLIAPKDIPKILRKLGKLFNEVNKIKEDLIDMKNEIQENIKDEELKNLKDEADLSKDIYSLDKRSKKSKK